MRAAHVRARLVPLEGFAPPALRSVAECSDLLSYRGRKNFASLVGVEPDVSRLRGERPRPLDESDVIVETKGLEPSVAR